QAEDGIRDGHVTGVQTCALPISRRSRSALRAPRGGIDQEAAGDRGGRPRRLRDLQAEIPVARIAAGLATRGRAAALSPPLLRREIGRASCRERVWSSVVGVSLR